MKTPEVRGGTLRIAHEVFGSGPIDLVYGRTARPHVRPSWEGPSIADWFRKLATATRVIPWYKRGVGLSERAVGTSTLEDQMNDPRAVRDPAGSQRVAIEPASSGSSNPRIRLALPREGAGLLPPTAAGPEGASSHRAELPTEA